MNDQERIDALEARVADLVAVLAGITGRWLPGLSSVVDELAIVGKSHDERLAVVESRASSNTRDVRRALLR